MSYVWVFIGGGLGSLCRFGLSQWLNRPFSYPWGTFLANGLSCILLGILVALVSKNALPIEYRLLLITGFCGGFSTFSTFSNELVQFIRHGEWTMAMFYMTGSLLVGLLGIFIGMKTVMEWS